MIQLTLNSIKDIESLTSKTLVGEMCKLVDEIEKQSLSKEQSLSLLKSLLKNKIYESSRNHTNLLIKFSEGYTSFSIKPVRPKD